MAIRYRPGNKSPWQVYWNNPITKKRESKSFSKKSDAVTANKVIKEKNKDILWRNSKNDVEVTHRKLEMTVKKFFRETLI